MGLIHRRMGELAAAWLAMRDNPRATLLFEIVEHLHRDVVIPQAKLNVSLRTIAVYGDVFNGHVHRRKIEIALVRYMSLQGGLNGGIRVGRVCLLSASDRKSHNENRRDQVVASPAKPHLRGSHPWLLLSKRQDPLS